MYVVKKLKIFGNLRGLRMFEAGSGNFDFLSFVSESWGLGLKQHAREIFLFGFIFLRLRS